MAEVLAYSDIPGWNNLEMVIDHLTSLGIPARGGMQSMVFAHGQPVSLNSVYVDEVHLEEARQQIEMLRGGNWVVFGLRPSDTHEGGQ